MYRVRGFLAGANRGAAGWSATLARRPNTSGMVFHLALAGFCLWGGEPFAAHKFAGFLGCHAGAGGLFTQAHRPGRNCCCRCDGRGLRLAFGWRALAAEALDALVNAGAGEPCMAAVGSLGQCPVLSPALLGTNSANLPC
jgi:hypothetical protein